jgi:hypothetical protein
VSEQRSFLNGRSCQWLFIFRCASMFVFHGDGPRVKHHIERPITDVVVTENLIGSLT